MSCSFLRCTGELQAGLLLWLLCLWLIWWHHRFKSTHRWVTWNTLESSFKWHSSEFLRVLSNWKPGLWLRSDFTVRCGLKGLCFALLTWWHSSNKFSQVSWSFAKQAEQSWPCKLCFLSGSSGGWLQWLELEVCHTNTFSFSVCYCYVSPLLSSDWKLAATGRFQFICVFSFVPLVNLLECFNAMLKKRGLQGRWPSPCSLLFFLNLAEQGTLLDISFPAVVLNVDCCTAFLLTAATLELTHYRGQNGLSLRQPGHKVHQLWFTSKKWYKLRLAVGFENLAPKYFYCTFWLHNTSGEIYLRLVHICYYLNILKTKHYCFIYIMHWYGWNYSTRNKTVKNYPHFDQLQQ